MKLKIITISILSLFIVYGTVRAKDVFLGSPIQMELHNQTSSLTSLRGTAKHTKTLLINGENTPITTEGNFGYTFSPLPGLNVVTINSQDIFGNSKEKVYSFVYNNEQGNKTAQR